MDCLSFALEIKPTGIWTSENTASPQETVRTLASALLSLTVITRTISDIHRHFQSLWEILCADAKPLITSAGLHRSRRRIVWKEKSGVDYKTHHKIHDC
jgi:hypothetical protein